MQFIIPVVIFFGITLLARAISEKSLRKLGVERKAELIDLFSKHRIWSLGIMFGSLILFFLSMQYSVFDPKLTAAVYAAVMSVYIIIMNYIYYKTLKKNQFPDFYIKSHLLTATMRFSGFVILLACLLYFSGN